MVGVAAEKLTRQLQTVEARRPCGVTWVKPRQCVYSGNGESRGRAPTPIRLNDPPDAAPPATRYGTGSSKREPHRVGVADTEPALSTKTWQAKRRAKETYSWAAGVAAVSTHSSETAGHES